MIELDPAHELFRELSPEELGRVAAIAECHRHEPGDLILRQGFPADAIYIVRSGAVRVTAVLAEGDPQEAPDEELLVQLGPGEIFGEISFITGRPPSLSVIAEAATELVLLPRQPLYRLLDSDAVICRKLLFAITRTLVDRLARTGRELVLARYFIRTA